MVRAAAKVTAAVPAADCCGSLLDESLSAAGADQLAQAFSALGDPIRLRLLNLIADSPDGEVCVCDLVPAVGRSQPTVSHHLRILGEAGLVEGDRRGKWVWYSVNRARLDELRSVLGRSGR
jgi:ArsR family transcriptional regulator